MTVINNMIKLCAVSDVFTFTEVSFLLYICIVSFFVCELMTMHSSYKGKIYSHSAS